MTFLSSNLKLLSKNLNQLPTVYIIGTTSGPSTSETFVTTEAGTSVEITPGPTVEQTTEALEVTEAQTTPVASTPEIEVSTGW